MSHNTTSLRVLVLTAFLINSCATEPVSTVVLPITGSHMTPEWLEYNKQAEVRGMPQLVFAVTAKDLARTVPEQPKGIQDVFSAEDEQLVIFTTWTSIKGRPRYQLKVYDPRGVVFHEAASVYRFGTQRWGMWNTLYIKGWPAARLPGRWRAEIYMDDVLALKKEFFIGSTARQYETKPVKSDALAIGVHPYFVDADTSRRDNSTRLPSYIAQMLLVDFENYRIITPFQLRDAVPRPVLKYDQYAASIRQELNYPDSPLMRAAEKFKLDFLITGAVYDFAQFDYAKEASILLVDVRKKEAKEITATFTSDPARDRTGFQVRANFYRAIYDEIVRQGPDALKIKK